MSQPRKKPPQIFISHVASSDKEIAKKFRDWIRVSYHKTNVGVFVSSADGINPGAVPATEIEQALRSTDALIVLLSNKALKSDWIVFEPAFVLGRKKTVLPLLCNGASFSEVPSSIKYMLQLKDASDANQFAQTISKLDTVIGCPHEESYEELRNSLSQKNRNVPMAPLVFPRRDFDDIPIM